MKLSQSLLHKAMLDTGASLINCSKNFYALESSGY